MKQQKYFPIRLERLLSVEQIVTIHYFEYTKDFTFPGETHDFWEFLYVDKGTACVKAGDTLHTLTSGDIIFHKPMEFHTVYANGEVAPNLVVISFCCHSDAMKFFDNKLLKISDTERNLLASILREAKMNYSTPLNDPYTVGLERAPDCPKYGDQLIATYLEEFLISLMRRYQDNLPSPTVSKLTKTRSDEQLYKQIRQYMAGHLQEQLCVAKICAENSVGRSVLQRLFREYENCGVMNSFARMKINSAKEMIRAESMNFTQMAQSLGYSSIHYFSRQFREITGMSPSEYARSVKACVEISSDAADPDMLR